MSDDNIETVRAWERAMQGGYGPDGNFAPVLGFLSSNIEVIEAESLPYAGTYVGHDGFRQLARIINTTWRFAPGKRFDYVGNGNRVVVLTLGRAFARSTGREVEWRLAEVCTLEDGLITSIRPFYWDTQALNEALQPASLHG